MKEYMCGVENLLHKDVHASVLQEYRSVSCGVKRMVCETSLTITGFVE